MQRIFPIIDTYFRELCIVNQSDAKSLHLQQILKFHDLLLLERPENQSSTILPEDRSELTSLGLQAKIAKL